MADPFLGEIKIVSFPFAPKGWAMCNGQFLPINQNQALFALLGTMYGGNGQTTYALPDLRGRAPIHFGEGFIQGQKGGEAAHTVTLAELPAHQHNTQVSSAVATTNSPDSNLTLAQSSASALYAAPDQNMTAMSPAAISTVGGNQPHTNMQPYTVLNFCIALVGIFPSHN